MTRRPVDLRVDAMITAVRAEMTRVDSKAAMLLALAATGLSGGLAVLGSGRLVGGAAAAGWAAVAAVTGGLVALASSVWPRLTGGYGFMVWAVATNEGILHGLTTAGAHHKLHELRSLSHAVRTKYRRIQTGMALLGLALVPAILAAALATNQS